MTMKCLLILFTLGLLLSGCAQENAKADIMLMNARRDDQARAIQQQYAQAQADVQADALAKLELEKRQAQQQIEIDRAAAEVEYQKQTDLNRLAAEFKRNMDKLDAEHQSELAQIQARTDRARADAARDVILALSIGLGGSLLVILVGRGIGNGITAWARNRGETVRPDPATGQFPAIVRSNGIYMPNLMTGSYVLISPPHFIERFLISLGEAVAIARGKPVQKSDHPWVQQAAPSAEQLQVTSRAQAHGLLTAATRNGANQRIAERAVSAVFDQPSNALLMDGRLPAAPRTFSPEESAHIMALLEDIGD